MAQIVVGIGTSHSPQLSVPATHWPLLHEKDEQDPRLNYKELLQKAKPDIQKELAPEKWRDRYEACQKGIAELGRVLAAAAPDVIVVVGDDQHEQFLDDNLPAFAVYHGKSLVVSRRKGANLPAWRAAEEEGWAETAGEYQTAWQLAEHLIAALTADEFDVARSNRLREGTGIGHAFSFLYRRIWPGAKVPIVPVMLNTYYPPNQPTPKRCYALGQALRRSIESWDGAARVAIMASGGLSHVILDEALDQQVIEAMLRRDRERLYSLPREKLRGGTSEILNWVVAAGALEPMTMRLVDYVPTYRSPAATGCGMTFTHWS